MATDQGIENTTEGPTIDFLSVRLIIKDFSSKIQFLLEKLEKIITGRCNSEYHIRYFARKMELVIESLSRNRRFSKEKSIKNRKNKEKSRFYARLSIKYCLISSPDA